jgi:hypothetical protein
MTTKAKKSEKKIETTNKKAAAVKLHHEKPKTLEELKKEQGVKLFDFSIAGKNWPEGADFDKFTAAINSGRKHPREW